MAYSPPQIAAQCELAKTFLDKLMPHKDNIPLMLGQFDAFRVTHSSIWHEGIVVRAAYCYLVHKFNTAKQKIETSKKLTQSTNPVFAKLIENLDIAFIDILKFTHPGDAEACPTLAAYKVNHNPSDCQKLNNALINQTFQTLILQDDWIALAFCTYLSIMADRFLNDKFSTTATAMEKKFKLPAFDDNEVYFQAFFGKTAGYIKADLDKFLSLQPAPVKPARRRQFPLPIPAQRSSPPPAVMQPLPTSPGLLLARNPLLGEEIGDIYETPVGQRVEYAEITGAAAAGTIGSCSASEDEDPDPAGTPDWLKGHWV